MSVIDWLLDADPAIRWQVLRDLPDGSADDVAVERARVEHEGWGADLLGLEDPRGRGPAAPVSRPPTVIRFMQKRPWPSVVILLIWTAYFVSWYQDSHKDPVAPSTYGAAVSAMQSLPGIRAHLIRAQAVRRAPGIDGPW